MVREIFVACSWKADDDHTTSITKNGIELDFWPQLGFPYRYFQRVWVFRVPECGLDTLSIIRRRYRWLVTPICCKWLSHRVGWLRVQFNEGFLQVPRELIVSLGVLLINLHIFNQRCRPHAVLPLFALKPGSPLARIGGGTRTRPLVSTFTTTLVSVVTPPRLLVPAALVSVVAPISVVSLA